MVDGNDRDIIRIDLPKWKAITRKIIFITFQLSAFALYIALTKLVFTFNCNFIDYLFCLYTLVDVKRIFFDSTGRKGTSCTNRLY